MMKCICCQSDRFITSPFFLPSYFKCKKCGLIFKGILDNQKLHENIMHHYREIDPHDKIAESKASFFHFVLEYITLQFKDKKINLLDVGCGHGYFLEMAAARGIQTYGVEIENDSARSAQSKFGAHRIFNGEFLKAEYPNESFDVITLWDVLVMFEDPLKGLRKCHNILKEGGILGIRLRNVEFQKNIFLIYILFKKVALRLGIKKPYVFHPYCFNKKAISLLLSHSGFSNIKIINSPLSKGDPYKYISHTMIVARLKSLMEFMSKFVFFLSNGRYLIGPSLLIWAEKPRSENK